MKPFWVLLILATLSCKNKDVIPLVESEGYIIGFDPCTAKMDDKGFLIATLGDSPDTLLTYNLPDGLYNFPPELFQYYQFYFLFPLSEHQKYKVNFTYRRSNQDEINYSILCTADINLAEFKFFRERQIIIIHAKQIE